MGSPIVVRLSGFGTESSVRHYEPQVPRTRMASDYWFPLFEARLSAITTDHPDLNTPYNGRAVRYNSLPQEVMRCILDVTGDMLQQELDAGSTPEFARHVSMEAFISETNFIADHLPPQGESDGQ